MYLQTAFQQSNFLQTPKRNVMFQRKLKSLKIYIILYLSKTYMHTYKDKWGSDVFQLLKQYFAPFCERNFDISD